MILDEGWGTELDIALLISKMTLDVIRQCMVLVNLRQHEILLFEGNNERCTHETETPRRSKFKPAMLELGRLRSTARRITVKAMDTVNLDKDRKILLCPNWHTLNVDKIDKSCASFRYQRRKLYERVKNTIVIYGIK
jgi:hypothetical protein